MGPSVVSNVSSLLNPTKLMNFNTSKNSEMIMLVSSKGQGSRGGFTNGGSESCLAELVPPAEQFCSVQGGEAVSDSYGSNGEKVNNTSVEDQEILNIDVNVVPFVPFNNNCMMEDLDQTQFVTGLGSGVDQTCVPVIRDSGLINPLDNIMMNAVPEVGSGLGSGVDQMCVPVIRDSGLINPLDNIMMNDVPDQMCSVSVGESVLGRTVTLNVEPDEDDSYHLLSCLICPVVLEDVELADQGDEGHPAVVSAVNVAGKFSLGQIQESAGPVPPVGPLYTPEQAVGLANLVSSSGYHNYNGFRIPVRSHLNLPTWEFVLRDYEDEWVLRGSVYGWPLSRDRRHPISGVTWPNHSSAVRDLAKVKAWIEKEERLGAMVRLGPSLLRLRPPLSTIPLLTVPKPPDPTAVRVCGDCSYPSGFSHNDGIRSDSYCGEVYKLKLPTIWEFIASLRKIGLDDVMVAKADQSRGYRQIPVDPGDWLLQLFNVKGFGYLMDTRGIFGSRPCGMFMQRSNQAIAWTIVNTSVVVDGVEDLDAEIQSSSSMRCITTYIDDSLVAAHRACMSSVWSNVLGVHDAMNVTLSETEGHLSPPGRSVIALGFEVDCDAQTLSIPIQKLDEMLVLVSKMISTRSTTVHEMKVLLGRMARVIMVVRPGRRFINRLLLTIQGIPQPGYVVINLTDDAVADLRWWSCYGRFVNTRSLFSLPVMSREAVFVVDGRGASGSGLPSVGGLCYSRKEFFSCQVPEGFEHSAVHVIEALALVVAVRLWVPKLPSQSVIPVGSDNQSVIASVNQGKPRDRDLAALARLVWGVFAVRGSTCHLRYVPSKENMSDGVSRLNVGHAEFLIQKGWLKLSPDESLFSLNDDDHFLCQEGTPPPWMN